MRWLALGGRVDRALGLLEEERLRPLELPGVERADRGLEQRRLSVLDLEQDSFEIVGIRGDGRLRSVGVGDLTRARVRARGLPCAADQARRVGGPAIGLDCGVGASGRRSSKSCADQLSCSAPIAGMEEDSTCSGPHLR